MLTMRRSVQRALGENIKPAAGIRVLRENGNVACTLFRGDALFTTYDWCVLNCEYALPIDAGQGSNWYGESL